MPCIILYQPQIPPNTGNIIRMAANCGFDLHLIEPLGFSLDEKSVKRAGMDYIELANVYRYCSLEQCLNSLANPRLIIASTKGNSSYSTFLFSANDALLFGNESIGLPAKIWSDYKHVPSIYIPMRKGNRSLNIANAVAIISWACWQSIGFIDF